MQQKFVSREGEDPAEVLKPGVKRRLIHLENLMTVIVDFEHPMEEPDPPHSHPHEQITFVASGELYFYIGDKQYFLEQGDMICIPAGEPHTVRTVTPDVRLIDSFSPVREDFLK
ncbi:MAG: cupin domain-containing protein [Bacteroidota bacterium]